jgi:hypothetical protein
MLKSEQNPSLRSAQATATMLSRFVAVQECDATEDHSSTAAGPILRQAQDDNKKKTAVNKLPPTNNFLHI